ncbi:MAG: hypothetical protein ACRC92_26530 [Peptostreptococcaceae bacterium]
MSIPMTGPISASAINKELGREGRTQMSIGRSAERDYAQVFSGAIKYSDFRGKRLRLNKIRFTSDIGAAKDNHGTTRAIFRNASGGVIMDIYGGSYIGHYVCPSAGEKEWSVTRDQSIALLNVASVEFVRFLDTSSHGWASIKVEFEINGEWKEVLYDRNYRTGKQWEAKTYSLRHP